MNPARIAEQLEPYLGPYARHSQDRSDQKPSVLSPAQLQDISTYIDILLRWNTRINLTAIRDPEDIVTRHFGESFFAARLLFPDPAHAGTAGDLLAAVPAAITVADLGSGAGFPGLPIKLWAPQISLTLIESNQKKATFLREVTRALILTNVNIQTARAESLTGLAFDVVTLRAVERFETVLPTAASLLAHDGCLALLLGSSQLAAAKATLPQLAWSEPVPIPSSRSRIIIVARRTA